MSEPDLNILKDVVNYYNRESQIRLGPNLFGINDQELNCAYIQGYSLSSINKDKIDKAIISAGACN